MKPKYTSMSEQRTPHHDITTMVYKECASSTANLKCGQLWWPDRPRFLHSYLQAELEQNPPGKQ